MDTSVALRFRVRELREARGWSQKDLAARAGRMRIATLNRIELNRTGAISLGTLEALGNALGVDPGYLIERVPITETKRRGR